MFHKLKNGHWPVFLLSSLSSLGNLFLPIILVRLLSPEDVGIYKIFFLHMSAIPFLFMAGGPVHSVFYWVGHGEDQRGKYLNATWVLTIALSCLVLILGLPFREFLASHLDIPHQYVTILLLTGALFCPTGHFTESSIALGKNIGSIFDTISELLKAAGFIFIAWWYRDLSAMFLFFVIFMTIKIFLVAYFNKKFNKISFATDKVHIKKVFLYCLPMSVSGLLGFFVDKVDMLLLSSHLDATSFAYYSMGCLAIPPLYLLEMAVQKVLIPNISKDYLARDWSAGSASYRKAIKDISFLLIPSIFGLSVFATPIIRMLYTDQYLESVTYLQIFAFTYLLFIFPHDSVARATGKTSWILKMYVIITPISLAAAVVAAHFFGAKGVLIATTLVKFAPKVLGMKLSKEIMHWEWKDMFPFKHLILFTFICTMLSIGCYALKVFFQNDIMWFLTCGSAFGVIYLITANYFGKKGKYANA